MRVILKKDLLIVAPTDEGDESHIAEWKSQHPGYHFQAVVESGSGLVLRSLGDPRLNQPINVTSRHPDPHVQLIGNFAATPFILDGVRYASVESFWQSLKFETKTQRLSLASLPGIEAKRAGQRQPTPNHFFYGGNAIPTGSLAHWALMARACTAKFDQNEEARQALIATFPHPLEHRPKRDSVTIPGFVMARIWTDIRQRWLGQASN
ncbi:MAG: hypothetical protein U1A77_03025 [Pirellulales bacterium]